ncbi:MAG: NB-ARC domain-containing protein, partial [Scytonema sp. PMC 1070.18]|nr:NB-ARC domain-containing protein [Scytonema sp. PMC 1070.18]
MQKQRRQRGVVLTPEGLEKLQNVRIELEYKENEGKKYTFEQLSETTGLDINTIKKVFDAQQGVDKRTLERVYESFHLKLDKNCYSKSIQNKRIDWGEAICTSAFYGRTHELALLEQWLLCDNCRLVTVLGMGGIGKTSLSVKLAQRVQDKYEYVMWRSLREAPPIEVLLSDLIQFLSEEEEIATKLPESNRAKVIWLLEYLRNSRCLIVLDNAESILRSGTRAGQYKEGYEEYGNFLRVLGETTHQSCIILTSREKPRDVASIEGEQLPVRSLQLCGLDVPEAQEIFKVKGLIAAEDEWKEMTQRYAGNPLVLKIVATTIKDVFDGNVTNFLQQDTFVFGDIQDILEEQFERLSNLEKEIMYWLAINREPVTLLELQEDIVSPIQLPKLLEALESLCRRSLIEKTTLRDELRYTPTLIEKSASLFTLQPVVMEYVTQRLIERVCNEILTQNIDLLKCHALMKAIAKEYVRETQIRLILKPVIEGLLTVCRSKSSIENQLTQILATIREKSSQEESYIAGNIINLLCQLQVDLSGYDFSHLTVWQADLRNVKLHDVNFSSANLAKSVFAETFGGVLSVAFSPDGKILALGDTNGEIRLYQVSDWKQLLSCKGHTNWVVSLAFSPDGRTFASSSIDYAVKLWDASTGECLQSLQGHKSEVWSVAFSPDSYTLASGSDDCTVKLWSVQTGECKKTFVGHTSWVCSVTFSTDGQILFSGSDDHTVRLWDINTSECLKVFQGHSDGIRSIALSLDGKMLASGSQDQTIKLWDVSNGECLKTFHGHLNEVYSVSFRSQGDIIASASFDQTVRLWSVYTGECIKTFHGHSGCVFSVAFSPQGDILVSGSQDQTMRLWSVYTSEPLKTLQGYTNQVLSVAFSPDGHKLASGGHDCSVKLWDVK